MREIRQGMLEQGQRLADDELAAQSARRFDAVVSGLKIRPYPAPEAIANTYEIATIEFPEAAGLNPLSLWDLHWVKELDDAGFIDDLTSQLQS